MVPEWAAVGRTPVGALGKGGGSWGRGICAGGGGRAGGFPCAGIDDLLQIIDVDSADAEDRQIHFRVNSLDIGKADRRVVGFGRCGEDWAEADVICAFALRGNSLFEAMG